MVDHEAIWNGSIGLLIREAMSRHDPRTYPKLPVALLELATEPNPTLPKGMREIWADQEDCILIEHDVTFEPEAIRLLETCRGVWCMAGPYFQLCRFRAELMRATPDAFERIPHLERHWMTLQQSFAGKLAEDPRLGPLRRSHGVHNHCGEVHVFNPGAHASHGAGEYQRWYRQEELSRKIAEVAPCDQEYCKRGHSGRNRCPNCIDNPLIVIRDSDGTLRNADGSVRWQA